MLGGQRAQCDGLKRHAVDGRPGSAVSVAAWTSQTIAGIANGRSQYLRKRPPARYSADDLKPRQASASHRLAGLDRVFESLLRQPMPLLEEVNPQHPLHTDGQTPLSLLR